MQLPRPQTRTIGAGTIPLGKTAPGCGTEDRNTHSKSGLELGVCVRADFTVQADLFVPRGRPFHSRCSLLPTGLAPTRKGNTERGKKQYPNRNLSRPSREFRFVSLSRPSELWSLDVRTQWEKFSLPRAHRPSGCCEGPRHFDPQPFLQTKIEIEWEPVTPRNSVHEAHSWAESNSIYFPR
jgi:hypothetical protein